MLQALRTCISEMFGSNLEQDTGYPDLGFSRISQQRRQMLGQYSDQATTASFQFVSNPFINLQSNAIYSRFSKRR
jgi:hypothetical protein